MPVPSRHATTAPVLAPPPPSQFDAAAVSEALQATATRFPGLAAGVAGALGAVAVHSLSAAACDATRLPTAASLTPGGYATGLDQPRHWSSTLPSHGGTGHHLGAPRGPPPCGGAPRWDDAPSAAKARSRLGSGGGGAHGGAPSEAEEQTVAALLVALQAAETAPGRPHAAAPHHLGAQAVRAAQAVAAAAAAAGAGGNVTLPAGAAAGRPSGLQASHQQGVPPWSLAAHQVPGLEGLLLMSPQQGAWPRPLTWEDISREASVSSRDPQLAGATVEQLVEAAAVYDHPAARLELRARLALAVAALRAKQAAGEAIWPLPEPPQM